MTNLVDGKTWKTTLNSLPEEIVKTENARVSQMLDLILGAKLKQTMKEKRKTQMAMRKYLVRNIFQVFGQERGVQFLHNFVQVEAPFIENLGDMDTGDSRNFVKKIGMIFDVLTISAQSAGGVKNVFKDLVCVVHCEGNVLVQCQKEQPLLLAKQRANLMDHILTLFKTTKEFTWPKEDQILVMERCIWPILKPKTSNSDPEADKIHHMAKIADLFQIWSDQEQYRTLFFLTGHGMLYKERESH